MPDTTIFAHPVGCPCGHCDGKGSVVATVTTTITRHDPACKTTTPEDKSNRLKQVLSNTERAAYASAHRIMSEQLHNATYASESFRRISAVDKIAEIIMQEFGESSTMARTRTKRPQTDVDTQAPDE
jgi:hypothetical protein